MMAKKTFIEITNKDIYDMLMKIKSANEIAHSEIIKHQIETNGKVKINKITSSAAVAGVMLILGWIVSQVI